MTTAKAARRPKLLLTVNDAGFFLSHRLPIAVAARAAGYDVHVATAPGPAVARIRAEGFPHHPVPLSRRGLNPLAELRSVAALTRLYRRLRPDIVHHVTIKPVLYGGLAARLARVPAVVAAISGLGFMFMRRDVRYRVSRLPLHALYRLALGHPKSKVIFQNPDDLRQFTAAGWVRDGSAVLIKGSGVDLAAFAPAPEPHGTPIVLCAARMLWDKGIGEFVAAARDLRARGVEARFVLVGDPDPGNPTSVPPARLEAWHREGAVEWWGHRDDMPAVMQLAAIVCLPSYREGLPKVLIEAAACARPVVTTDVPGCRDIGNALLVPPQNASALADALARLIAEPMLRQHLAARGREIAEAEFSLERVVRDTLAVYAALTPEGALGDTDATIAAKVPCTPI